MRRSSQFALSISMLAGLQSEFAVPAVAVDSSPSFKSAIESCKEQLSLPLSEKLERLLEKAFDAARTGKNDPSSDHSIIDQGPLSGTETNNFNAYLSCSMVYPLKVRQPQPEPNEHEMFVAASRPADFLNNSGQQISKACEHGDYKNGDQSLAILCLGKEVLKGSGIQVKAAITDFHKIGCQKSRSMTQFECEYMFKFSISPDAQIPGPLNGFNLPTTCTGVFTKENSGDWVITSRQC